MSKCKHCHTDLNEKNHKILWCTGQNECDRCHKKRLKSIRGNYKFIPERVK